MSRFFNFYAGGTDNEIPQLSSTNYWFGFTELCLINTLKLEASDLFEAQEISAAFPPLFSLSFEIFLHNQSMDNKKWNKCAETLDWYERKNAWGRCLILIWMKLFIFYILNHVKRPNEVYLENISERLQLLREPSWTTGCFSFFPSAWNYNHFWIFSQSNEALMKLQLFIPLTTDSLSFVLLITLIH